MFIRRIRWFGFSVEALPGGRAAAVSIAQTFTFIMFSMSVWRPGVRSRRRGDVIIVRYADDAVPGFECREEADRFLEQLRERLAQFGRELHPDKTRLIEFGRQATERRKKRGEGKPQTFTFLGFTHYCGVNHTTRNFTVHRKTIGKRMTAKLKDPPHHRRATST
jgi:hypothetical protein